MDKVVVSITSYPARMPYIASALRSVLAQCGDREHVVLWLGEDRFANGLADLPEDVLALSTARGGKLDVRFVHDVRSFTKLLPALSAFPGLPVITLDDDILYAPGVISKLEDAAAANPGAIVVHCASDLYRVNGTWRRTTGNVGLKFGSPFLRMPIGAGGAYYPPGALDPLVMDVDLALRLCPTSDDIWFWFCAVRRRTPVVLVKNGITRRTSAEGVEAGGALSAINEVNDDEVNLRHLRNLFDHDPGVEAFALEEYRRWGVRVFASRLIRLFVHYPRQAWFCLRAGGVRYLAFELRRKFAHFGNVFGAGPSRGGK